MRFCSGLSILLCFSMMVLCRVMCCVLGRLLVNSVCFYVFVILMENLELILLVVFVMGWFFVWW